VRIRDGQDVVRAVAVVAGGDAQIKEVVSFIRTLQK
jgi:hypothetical protein